MQTIETDVLIIGAGPTGLALAVTLQQARIRHLVIDKLAAGQNTSRAAVIHAHTLEVLDSIGVSQALADVGLKLSNFTYRDRSRALLPLQFDALPSRFPYLLMLPQDVTERILAERLVSLGGSIARGETALEIHPSGDRIAVLTSSASGGCTIQARYVVGADGVHSVVRDSAGIGFEGATYPETFVLADVQMEWPFGNTEVSLFFSPEGLVVVSPLPGGTYRVVATLDNAPEMPQLEDIQKLIGRRGPGSGAAKVTGLAWSLRFRIHHRLAWSYRSGRLFLAGDAAHVHSPAGGQGMNCGLVDACVLGQLLAGVLQNKRPESALDLYEQLRRPAAAEVLRLAGRLTGMATLKGRVRRSIRNALFAAANQFNPVKRKLLLGLSGLSRRHLSILPK
jgi:2-polyprenyl-6-methoxyphenol hydroxylase-like FAD-dependent oxidoreductase